MAMIWSCNLLWLWFQLEAFHLQIMTFFSVLLSMLVLAHLWVHSDCILRLCSWVHDHHCTILSSVHPFSQFFSPLRCCILAVAQQRWSFLSISQFCVYFLFSSARFLIASMNIPLRSDSLLREAFFHLAVFLWDSHLPISNLMHIPLAAYRVCLA